MYVKASVIAEHPVRQSIEALLDGDDSWFPLLVETAQGVPGEHLLGVGFTVAGVPVEKRVTVELEPTRHGLDWLRLGFSWKPTLSAGMFPGVHGELHLEPNSYRDTLITVSGTYAPPLGAAGRGLDRVLLHKVAEATFRSLAESIEAELGRRLATR